MTLATRCPSCGTVFRVVQDQLRVSDGWVRCGRCNGVFDATEVLFDIDSGAAVSLPPELAAPPTPSAEPVEPPTPEPPAPPIEVKPRWTEQGPPEPGLAADTQPEPPPEHPQREEPLLRAPSRSNDDEGDERIVVTDHRPGPASAAPSDPERVPAPTPVPAAPPAVARAGAAPQVVPATSSGAALPASAMVQAPPSFLHTAERTAMWRRPVVRAGLWVGVLLLALGLMLQMALLWRDHLAAHWPASTPALQALCRVAGCQLQPLRRIESLSVESSGLNRVEGSSLYQLQLVLRNRADTAVMMPALDLSLTDAQGQLVSRRVLPVAELGPPQPALVAGQELPIKALLSTGERRVEGYTLELFYP